MVQFNGGVWHSPTHESSFLNYWKTVNGGEFLSRYKDGKVNEAIADIGSIPQSKLKKYLDSEPYGPSKENSLFFTLSPYAKEFRAARLDTLKSAVLYWKELDAKYPNTIQAFTTDSEISSTSFRDYSNGQEIPIGFEKWNTSPFCKLNHVKNCKAFFAKDMFNYNDPLELKWFEFRAKNHLAFVQDTVDTIRRSFPTRPIFTHQISVLDKENPLTAYKKQDLASPQWTAFAHEAYPGFTVYAYDGDRYGTQKNFIQEVSTKVSGETWGLLEFNTARAFKGTKQELARFTRAFIDYAYMHGVRVIAPLSWEANSLDNGIKDSGVDEGIKMFLENRSE